MDHFGNGPDPVFRDVRPLMFSEAITVFALYFFLLGGYQQKGVGCSCYYFVSSSFHFGQVGSWQG